MVPPPPSLGALRPPWAAEYVTLYVTLGGSVRVQLTVPGEPIPQGSTRSLVSASTGKVVTMAANRRTAGWRADVATLAAQARPAGWDQRAPMYVWCRFAFDRPGGHFGTRGLRPSAPLLKTTRPDLDKLGRAVLDALTAVLWADDAQVVSLDLAKGFSSEAEPAGLHLLVEALAR